MSKVYVVHRPSRWRTREREMIPLDLSPAEVYGELVVILPGGHLPPATSVALPIMRQMLAHYTPEDYLLIAGDMCLLVWAALLAMRATGGKLKLLRWNNRTQQYEATTSPPDLWTSLGETKNG